MITYHFRVNILPTNNGVWIWRWHHFMCTAGCKGPSFTAGTPPHVVRKSGNASQWPIQFPENRRNLVGGFDHYIFFHSLGNFRKSHVTKSYFFQRGTPTTNQTHIPYIHILLNYSIKIDTYPRCTPLSHSIFERYIIMFIIVYPL